MHHEQIPKEIPAGSFPRQVRLTSARDYEKVLRRPDLRIRSGPLHLNAVFTRMHTARLGLVVGKKAVAQANQRNRIKRSVREAFRKHRAQLARHDQSVDIVVRVTGNLSSARLRQDLDLLFARVGKQLNARQESDEG